MANILQLPVDANLPWFSFTITLENAGYRLEMAYNTRAARWSLTIRDAAGEPIVRNIPILIDRDLLKIYRTLPVPQGSLICIDTTGKQTQPTMGSFLTTHALYYIESGA